MTETFFAGPDSFEATIQAGINRAFKILKSISGAWDKDQKVDAKYGTIARYRVNMKVSFILEEPHVSRGPIPCQFCDPECTYFPRGLGRVVERVRSLAAVRHPPSKIDSDRELA